MHRFDVLSRLRSVGMGQIWLRDLPTVLRRVGLTVEEWPGWENRGRSTGGYDAVYGIGIHHTASTASLVNECGYLWDNASDKPIGAMLIGRDGTVVVGAAGATNTQGRGGPVRTSHGTIPKDAGNRYLISIEAQNNGKGEPWPKAQTDAYVAACAAMCEAYDLDPLQDIFTHAGWSPGRKPDPAGPSPWATGTNTWDQNGFRQAVYDCINQTEEPPPVDPYAGYRFVRPDPYAQVFCVSPLVGGPVEAVGQDRMAELVGFGVPSDVQVFAASNSDAASLARRAGLNPDNPREYWQVGNPPSK